RLERLRNTLAFALQTREDDDVHLIRRDAPRPCGDPSFVVVLLDGGGEDSPRTDAVASHHDRALLSVLVEEAGAERLRVVGVELEDVPDLDGDLEAQLAAAPGARVALFRDANIGEAGFEIASVLDPAQVVSGAV